MVKLNDIIARVRDYHAEADFDLIKRAYVYSTTMHQGQVRKSGEAYVSHPLEVAYILAELKMDEATVCTGLLHDTVEDTLATLEEVEKVFGKEIAALVDGVTKLSAVEFTSAEEKQAENFRKMLVAMAKDIRVILVKLADRLHNMRTMEFMKAEKQEKISQETLDIYAPLANRLGISWMKTELEDLAFRYTHGREYKEISETLGQSRKERDDFIEEVVGIIRGRLKGTALEKAEVYGRPKHLFSIYKKMRDKQVGLDGLYDIIAFRILCDDVTQCYEALGHIHGLWRPVPGRFKDYIAMPKPNMYQSLHTTVVGPEGQRVEIQIRTHEMHAIAEEGIAAHWQYKERGSLGKTDKDDRKFAWLRQLLEWQQELKDPTEFMESVKVDLFSEEVYVFTPKGRVIELPRGATPVDFAFAIHSEVGHHCAGGKVNGRIVPLKHQLKNGDTVEIITNPNQRPNKDWLQFVKSGRAKNRIRAFVRQAERERSAEIGRELLEREFKRAGGSLQKVEKNGELVKAFAEGRYRTGEEILVAVGYGKLSPQHVLERVLGPEAAQKAAEAQEVPEDQKTASRLGQVLARLARRSSTQASGIVIEGIDDMMVRYGKCCNPVQGDPIVGFVTRGRGLTIHTRDCPQSDQMDPARRVAVTWDDRVKLSRPVTIRVHTEDREGMLADLSQVFTKNGINISIAHCKALETGGAVNSFRVGIVDLEQLRKVVKALENVKGVHRVDRARGEQELEN
ncbi:MAG: bifunctional (p)ppGpp synthetase/guanosine-3',5'-bis(diphosphate) 3'-pyrophosphohydrolase [Deltaproteobacteria bacterium]|nr:bifunctional (p)ppGpp synthetase/guanosine-3',5'-bis(diphosphate) 3'-pyrophosphohydrolase [Deltaproteobacteria bacterium]